MTHLSSRGRTLLTGLSLVCLLGLLPAAFAQTPVPYLITSACPGSANNPSVLRMVPPTGAPVTIGTINVAGTGIVVNGAGASSTDPLNIYAMSSATGGGFAALAPPQFYRISLANAAATALGPVTPPPAPAATFPNIGQSFVINQAADAGPASNYYLTGASLVYNLFTNTVSNVKLYIGEINLAPVPSPVAPVWKQVDTSDPSAAAIISALTTQANAFLAGSGPLPDGGFQDIAYVPATGNIVTYLGVEQKFVVVSNITGPTPVVSVLTPTTPLPLLGGSARQIGAIWRSATGEFFGLRSATGYSYKFDPATGDYLNKSYITFTGCTLGDATTAPGVVPLPVTLTQFGATTAGAGVQLAWQTASEENVDRFVVERSADGRTWVDGPAVAATNKPGGARYSVLDKETRGSYYRLRMEDRDGHRAWSEARTISAPSGQVTLLPVWPNPARTAATITLSAAVAGEATLLNQLGQVVWRAALSRGQVEADVSALPVGVYELVVRFGEAQTARQRLVIEHP